MSASLVGSEMCIRDSPHPPRRRPRHPLRAQRPSEAPAAQRARAAPTGRGPVSYTHLTLPTICSV
eukprot:2040815-Alexandrium_andersonii.AAC.1